MDAGDPMTIANIQGQGRRAAEEAVERLRQSGYDLGPADAEQLTRDIEAEIARALAANRVRAMAYRQTRRPLRSIQRTLEKVLRMRGRVDVDG